VVNRQLVSYASAVLLPAAAVAVAVGSLPLGSGLVEKPFDSSTLLRAVRELLDQPTWHSKRGSMPGPGPG